LEFYINRYYNAIPSTVESFNQWTQKQITKSGSTIVPQIFNTLEAQRFSELFIEVFYKHNRSPEVLNALKALMQNHLLPGYISIQ
jgi:alanine-alpha-ketoisovalerate/valine-pyruvate aminotransferase